MASITMMRSYDLVALLLLCIVCSSNRRTVNAFPAGAGSCLFGEPAVGGSHLDASNNVITGSLRDGEIIVRIDGDELHVDRVLTIYVDKVTPVLLKAPLSGDGIKGFLIRLGHAEDSSYKDYDLTNALSPRTVDTEEEELARETKVEGNFCAAMGASGLTHTDASYKYLMHGELLITEDIPEADLRLDVTAVVQNSGGTSEYYYTQYKLRAKTITPSPTDAPGTTYARIGELESSGATATVMTRRRESMTTIITRLAGLVMAVGAWVML